MLCGLLKKSLGKSSNLGNLLSILMIWRLGFELFERWFTDSRFIDGVCLRSNEAMCVVMLRSHFIPLRLPLYLKIFRDLSLHAISLSMVWNTYLFFMRKYLVYVTCSGGRGRSVGVNEDCFGSPLLITLLDSARFCVGIVGIFPLAMPFTANNTVSHGHGIFMVSVAQLSFFVNSLDLEIM